MLGDVGTSSGSQAFDRMKEKAEMLETRAKVPQDMLPESKGPISLENRFKALEAGAAPTVATAAATPTPGTEAPTDGTIAAAPTPTTEAPTF
eukprot:5415243-Prorocentrum_lima.AAC.1